jgi:hypothetical protein
VTIAAVHFLAGDWQSFSTKPLNVFPIFALRSISTSTCFGLDHESFSVPRTYVVRLGADGIRLSVTRFTSCSREAGGFCSLTRDWRNVANMPFARGAFTIRPSPRDRGKRDTQDADRPHCGARHTRLFPAHGCRHSRSTVCGGVQGYGTVFEIQGPTIKTFQVTTTTCVPWFTAERDASKMIGREATFTAPHVESFFIRTGGSSKHKLPGRYSIGRESRSPGTSAIHL